MSERAPGFEEYTPSRLEWLVVMLNSVVQYVNTIPSSEGVEYAYIPGADGKTIIMLIRHFADLDPDAVKRIEKEGKGFAANMAKSYKWDSWINIQTKLDPIDRQRPESA